MINIVIIAKNISSSDYGYIHFSTSKKNPEMFLLFQRGAKKAKIIIKEGAEETPLDQDSFILKLCESSLLLFRSKREKEAGLYESIKVLFDVTPEKFSEIRNRLGEIYVCDT